MLKNGFEILKKIEIKKMKLKKIRLKNHFDILKKMKFKKKMKKKFFLSDSKLQKCHFKTIVIWTFLKMKKFHFFKNFPNDIFEVSNCSKNVF